MTHLDLINTVITRSEACGDPLAIRQGRVSGIQNAVIKNVIKLRYAEDIQKTYQTADRQEIRVDHDLPVRDARTRDVDNCARSDDRVLSA